MSQQNTPEPFGYFRAEPFGWVDCSVLDEDAKPLYDQAVIDSLNADIATLEQSDKQVRARLGRVEKERDELLAALEKQTSDAKHCQQIMLNEVGVGFLDVVTIANSEAAIASAKEAA